MSGDVETTLRGPQAYTLAARALALMEARKIWPTPLNYELFVHAVGDPEGALGRELHRMLGAGEPLTDAASEQLAATFLPKARLNDQIRDTGDLLRQELANVSKAIAAARRSSEAYGATLADAGRGLTDELEAPQIKRIVASLSSATRKVERENSSLERKLADSTAEVGRLREHLEQVRREAMVDSLTNLANRKTFDEALTQACQDAERTGNPLTLALLDIDHFKQFNDTWGHQTGDQVIRYVASVLDRAGRMPRMAARYGGEEFALLLPGESPAAVGNLLETVRNEVRSRQLKRRSTEEDLGTVTISIGYAQHRQGEGCAALIERADAALYASKRTGRDRVTDGDVVVSLAA